MQNYLCMCISFSGERVHHFHQIIKGTCDPPKKGLQGLREIPVMHFISGLGNGGRKKKMPKREEGSGKENGDLSFPFIHLWEIRASNCEKELIKLVKRY